MILYILKLQSLQEYVPYVAFLALNDIIYELKCSASPWTEQLLFQSNTI